MLLGVMFVAQALHKVLFRVLFLGSGLAAVLATAGGAILGGCCVLSVLLRCCFGYCSLC